MAIGRLAPKLRWSCRRSSTRPVDDVSHLVANLDNPARKWSELSEQSTQRCPYQHKTPRGRRGHPVFPGCRCVSRAPPRFRVISTSNEIISPAGQEPTVRGCMFIVTASPKRFLSWAHRSGTTTTGPRFIWLPDYSLLHRRGDCSQGASSPGGVPSPRGGQIPRGTSGLRMPEATRKVRDHSGWFQGV